MLRVITTLAWLLRAMRFVADVRVLALAKELRVLYSRQAIEDRLVWLQKNAARSGDADELSASQISTLDIRVSQRSMSVSAYS